MIVASGMKLESRAGLLQRAAAACRERGDSDELVIHGMPEHPALKQRGLDGERWPGGRLRHGPVMPVLRVY